MESNPALVGEVNPVEEEEKLVKIVIKVTHRPAQVFGIDKRKSCLL